MKYPISYPNLNEVNEVWIHLIFSGYGEGIDTLIGFGYEYYNYRSKSEPPLILSAKKHWDLPHCGHNVGWLAQQVVRQQNLANNNNKLSEVREGAIKKHNIKQRNNYLNNCYHIQTFQKSHLVQSHDNSVVSEQMTNSRIINKFLYPRKLKSMTN